MKSSSMLCEGFFGRFWVWFEPESWLTCVLCDCVKGGSHKVESLGLKSGLAAAVPKPAGRGTRPALHPQPLLPRSGRRGLRNVNHHNLRALVK